MGITKKNLGENSGTRGNVNLDSENKKLKECVNNIE